MIYGVDCFKETTMKHKMLLYICKLVYTIVNNLVEKEIFSNIDILY